MRNISLLLCLFPIFIYAQITGGVKWELRNLLFEKYSQYDKIIYGDKYLSEIGKPELPVCSQSWVIPVNAEVIGIEKTVLSKTKLNGNYLVFPVQPSIPVNEKVDSNTFSGPDSAIYNSIMPFPSEQVKIISDRFVMGYHVITIESSPLEYIPLSKELYLCDISYTINYRIASNNSPSIISAKQTLLRRETVKAHIASIVQNSENVEEYAPLKNLNNYRTGFFQNKLMKNVAIDEERIPDYVIITNETLKPEFQRLADWKTKKGIPAMIKTVEEIGQDHTGCDLQEKIRNYLLAVKDRWGEGLFVLLGGDINIVPSKIVVGDEKALRPGDLYYNSYSISWDSSTNKLTEVPKRKDDFIFYMGRASVENSLEAKIFIDKVLQYEKLLANIDYSYFNNYLAVDAYLSKITNGKLYGGAMEDIDSIFNKYAKKNVNKWYLFDHFECNSNTDHEIHKYSKIHGGELNKSNFLDALNTGGNSNLNHFHFVYHMDHSAPFAMGTSSKDKNEMIINVDVNSLSNGDYFQIVMSGGCEPADFSKDCIAERFLNNPNGGAVAFIGNSDQGWSNEWKEFEYFMQALFKENSNMHQYSIALPFQKSYAGISTTLRFTYWRYHLLGDPEMPVWTDTPKNLEVETTPDTIVNGVNTIRVRVKNLPLNQEALICLMKGTEGYATLTVQDTDWHEFTFTPQTSGVVDVTVTAHNFRPFEGTVPVKVNDNSMVYMSNLTFDDDQSGASRGNGDKQLDAGETIELTVELKNSGNSPAQNVKAVLSCNSPEISILNNTVAYGNMAANSNKVPTAKFVFRIDSLSVERLKNDLNPVKFNLSIQEEAGSRIESFNIDIFAPEIELRNQKILSTSNGDLLIGPNETVTFTIDLMNMGKATATGLCGKLSVNSPYISACSEVQRAYPVMAKYETASNSVAYQFSTTGNYVAGTPLLFKLEMENEYGKKWIFDVDPVSRPTKIALSAMDFRSYETAIDIFWNKTSGASQYNIYRSEDGATNSYRKLNKFPLSGAYFKDESVNVYSAYFYKVTAISDKGNEGEQSDVLRAWTTCPSVGLFPVNMNMSGLVYWNRAPVNVIDVDNDGKKEIFSAMMKWDPDAGCIVGLHPDGTELFDIDGNVTTNSGFAIIEGTTLWGIPALGDLKSNGEVQIVVASRSGTPGHVFCYSTRDNDNDRKPDLLWSREVSGSSYNRGAVISNLNNNNEGLQQVVTASCEGKGGIEVWDHHGVLTANFANREFNTYGALAVADLDGDGDKEIILGSQQGVYIWHHNGSNFKGSPFFSMTGYRFDSSPVICDLDNDGKKEIVIASKRNMSDTKVPAESRVFALRLDGTLVSGWDGRQVITRPESWYCNDISVGDLDGDGHLEVVSLGQNCVKVWNYNGTEVLNKRIDDFIPFMSVPILADIDGDHDCEIIFTAENQCAIRAINLDGSDVLGFPIRLDPDLYSSVCVDDIDNDGKNELLCAAASYIYAWKTEGLAGCIEWGSERHDPQNTGEYGKVCSPLVIRESKVWNGSEDGCGNIILESGTLTVGSYPLTMNAASMLIVRPGATLEVNGGSILNANIKALKGSKVVVKNNGRIQLRKNGNLVIEQGAELDNPYGSIDVTK